MSSINEHYTFNYSQPEEYRLSHDSVFLARRAFEEMQGVDLAQGRGLDICSGSGIIGMDFLFHRRANNESVPTSFDFVEIQDVYVPHFNENVKRLGPIDSELQFVNCNYNELQQPKFADMYDIVLSGPPYFLTWQGKLSPSEFKNRCRFFIDSDLPNFFLGIANCLKKTGRAYILLRDLPEHKWDVIAEAREICAGKLNVDIVGDIRGTHFVLLTRV